MPSFKEIGSVHAAVLLALVLVMATGCAKEEVLAPGAAQPSMQYVPAGANGNDTIVPSDAEKRISPITDDGDNMGDNERSTKPKS